MMQHKAPQTALRRMVTDLVTTAVIALVIFGVMVGLKTDTIPGGLELTPRWLATIEIVAVVVLGRLMLHLIWWRRKPGVGAGTTWVPARVLRGWAHTLVHLGKLARPALLVFALVMPFLPFTDRYLLDLSILVLTYIMLGWGLNIVVGLAGLLDLGYVAFYAVGAYSYALLAAHFGWSFWLCLPLAGILASFWGIILGFPVLRLRGDYLAIVTLAFGEIIRIVLLNWYWFTGGPDGLSGIPRPDFFGIVGFERGPGGFADTFGLEYSSLHRIIFLYFLIRRAGAADQLCHHALAPPANWARLGGIARRRDRLPLAWAKHHNGQAFCLCHRGDVRRLCRGVLCHPSGLHLA